MKPPIHRSVPTWPVLMLAITPLALKANAQDTSNARNAEFDIGTIVVQGGEGEETSAGPVDGLRALTADTATGTRTPLKEVPQSITVVPRSVIDAQGVTNASDALRNVAGVQPNNRLSTPAFDTTLIRGFAAEQFRDGLSLYEYAPGDRESLIDVERIEVVKGPSAILYGGGSGAVAGGIINFVSKMPNSTPTSTFGTRFGTDGAGVFFDVNQPFSENILFRVTGEYNSQSYDVDVVDTTRFTISPTLLFAGDQTSLTLQARYSSWEQPEYQGLPATGTVAGGFRIDPDLFIGPADIEDSFSKTGSLTATLDHRFNEVWSAQARARVSWSEFEENVQTIFGSDGFVADVPFVPPSTWALANGELFQEQEELTLTASATGEFQTGSVKHILKFGADYSKLEDKGFLDAATLPAFVDLTAPAFFPYQDPGPGVNNSFVDNETYGLYAQLQSSFDNRLHLLGSLRLAHVEIDFRNATGSSKTSETRLLPRFGAVFDLTEEVSAFASYGEGIRGQPFLEFLGTAEPEQSRQIEAGLKFDLAAGLSGSVAVFQIDRENVAVTDGATFLSVAEGEQRSRGVDADLIWQINPRLTLLAGYAYVDAEFTKDAPTAADVIPAGNKLPGVPEHSGRLWLDYVFGPGPYDGLGIGAGIYAQSGEFLNENNAFKSDDFYTIDAALRYQTDGYRATLALRNLTDNRYFDRYGYFGGRVFQGEGLTATASLEFTF